MPDLELRPIEPADARAVHDLVTQPEVARAAGTTPFDTPHVFVQRFCESFEVPGVERLGAFRGQALVGLVEVMRGGRARLFHAAQLHLAVRGPERGRGTGTALLAAALDAADRWMGLVRIAVEILAEDGGALRFFERHGFVVEARCKCAIVVDGQLADTVLLGRIRPGFVQAEGALAPIPEPPPRRPPPPGPLVVRPMTPDDAPSFTRFSSDPSVLYASSQVPFLSVADWRKRVESGGENRYSMVALAGGVIVASGHLELFGSPRRRHVVSIGMSVLAGYQGMGIGDRLMTVLLETATVWLGAERVELMVLSDNLRAVRLYEKYGFSHEGALRHEIWRDGGYADSMVMARLYPRGARPG